MSLPAVDVGLIDEHLSAHEGTLFKLNHYFSTVKHPLLKKMINEQMVVMDNHVRVMLELLNPDQGEWIALETLNPSFDIQSVSAGSGDSEQLKRVVVDLESTSKHMANENYTSALLMKDPNVKHVHFQMAMQQATFQHYYAYFVEKMGLAFTPKATKEAQLNTIQHFNHLI